MGFVDVIHRKLAQIRKLSFVSWPLQTFKVIFQDKLGAIGLILVIIFIITAIIGPLLAPYGPFEVVFNPNNRVVRLVPPNQTNFLGTTNQGMDVFSQLLYGARIALMVGVISAFGSVMLGTLIGLFAGYYGKVIDQVLMRLTDISFGIPFLPFALIVISVTKPSLSTIILLIILFAWRTTSRVIRSQVLSLRERPFIWAARAAGTSDLKILFFHIGPNVLPFSFLYMAMGVSAGVLLEAGLSFIGFGDPNLTSWGQMLNKAFNAGAMRNAWWWVLPPGISLSFFVTSTFMITRAYEKIINPRLREI
ncbi:MAG: ABC transporter permease [Deltaproteobacteria bacterium]|nr:ABC transporter permease [Deltaproteobacteria bacterium]MBL7175772.1 ABC transporter permease [Desulfobacteraceae bacterium]